MDDFRVAKSIMRAFSIHSEGRGIFMRVSLILVCLFSCEVYCLYRAFAFAFRINRYFVGDSFYRLFFLLAARFFFYREDVRDRYLGGIRLAIFVVYVIFGNNYAAIPGRVCGIRASAFTRWHVTAFHVGGYALLIRCIVVFRRAFASARIVLFRLLLYAFGKI